MRFWAMLIAFIGMGMTFTSCSDDDDDINPIVGTWEKVYQYLDGTKIHRLTFSKDLTFEEKYITKIDGQMGSGVEEYSGTYVYDAENSRLFLTFKDATSYMEQYHVSFSDNTLILTDKTDSTEIFTKK